MTFNDRNLPTMYLDIKYGNNVETCNMVMTLDDIPIVDAEAIEQYLKKKVKDLREHHLAVCKVEQRFKETEE